LLGEGDGNHSLKLTQEEIQRRSELLELFRQGSIGYEQTQELKNLLEKEKQEASEAKDLILLLGIILLLGLVIDKLGNKEIDLDYLGKSIDEFIWGKRKKKK
jgi:hypothetical protein